MITIGSRATDSTTPRILHSISMTSVMVRLMMSPFLDSVNQEMIALRWDSSRRSFTGLGYRSLDTDSKIQPGR